MNGQFILVSFLKKLNCLFLFVNLLPIPSIPEARTFYLTGKPLHSWNSCVKSLNTFLGLIYISRSSIFNHSKIHIWTSYNLKKYDFLRLFSKHKITKSLYCIGITYLFINTKQMKNLKPKLVLPKF